MAVFRNISQSYICTISVKSSFVILLGTPCAQACYKQFIIGKFVSPVRHKHTISGPDKIEMSNLCLYPKKQLCVYLDLFDLCMTCICTGHEVSCTFSASS